MCLVGANLIELDDLQVKESARPEHGSVHNYFHRGCVWTKSVTPSASESQSNNLDSLRKSNAMTKKCVRYVVPTIAPGVGGEMNAQLV
jgi:hypothetical protein